MTLYESQYVAWLLEHAKRTDLALDNLAREVERMRRERQVSQELLERVFKKNTHADKLPLPALLSLREARLEGVPHEGARLQFHVLGAVGDDLPQLRGQVGLVVVEGPALALLAVRAQRAAEHDLGGLVEAPVLAGGGGREAVLLEGER
eukprot:scaffold12369_cov14-Prasinocladus_malaysianus.AAC.1